MSDRNSPPVEHAAAPSDPESITSDVLPCGVSIDVLLEQVAEGRGEVHDEHEQHCTHCRAALVEVGRLWSPVAKMAAERLEPPTDLVDSVMSRVRSLALEVWHAVLPGDRGVTRVASRVVGRIARSAASRVVGVRVVLGRSSQPGAVVRTQSATDQQVQPNSAVGIVGQHVVIDLAVVSEYARVLLDVGSAVRSVVEADLRDVAGIEDVEVNVIIDDVVRPPREPS